MFYRVVRVLFRGIAAPLFRFGVDGLEHVPPRGAAVVVCRHRSWLDPACVGGACPRPIRFLILRQVHELAWARWFFRGMRAVPVDATGEASLRALRSALRLLRSGEIVGIFPEGRVGREDAPLPLRPGAALLAIRAEAPLLPVAIRGSAAAWPHGRRWPGPARVHVRFGRPIAPPAAEGRAAVAALMQAVERALDEMQRGLEDRAR